MSFGTGPQTFGFTDRGPFHSSIKDLIYQITPEDTPFYNMIGEMRATNVEHFWTTRAIAGYVANTAHEGQTYLTTALFEDPNLPVRVFNFCQISSLLARVTRTAERMNTIGIKDLMRDQVRLRSTELKKSMEFTLLMGTLRCMHSAGDGTTRMSGGFYNVVTTNRYNYASAGSLTEDMFNGVLHELWSAGAQAQDVLVNGYMKRRVSTFTDSTMKTIQAAERRVINTIEIYDSDFGTTQIHKSRVVLGRDLFFLDRSFFDKVWLDEPHLENLGKMGDDKRFVVISEFTLQYGNQAAGASILNLVS